jgi:hypothetical protein
VNVIEIPVFKSIFVYAYTKTPENGSVYELLRYQLSFGRIDINTDFKFPVPGSEFNYSSLVELGSTHKQTSIYMFGGLMVRNPVIYKLHVYKHKGKIISYTNWTELKVSCATSPDEIEF